MDTIIFGEYGFEDEEDVIDRLYHDASEDELRKMGAFDNLNDSEELPTDYEEEGL